MTSLQGKVVFITGAARGIGAEVARRLHNKGAKLVLTDLSKSELAVMGARGMAIAGGTSEVTRNQIAERILGMPRDPLIS